MYSGLGLKRGKPNSERCNIKKISLATETETMAANLRDLEKLLGIKSLSVKYEPLIVFDINHQFIRSDIALLSYIFTQLKIAPTSTFKKELRMSCHAKFCVAKRCRKKDSLLTTCPLSPSCFDLCARVCLSGASSDR